MLGRQKPGRPVHVPIRRQPARIGQHDKRRQVVIQATQPVTDPRPNARKPGQHKPGRLHERRRPVHVRLRDHRMDERNVVDTFAKRRHRIAQPFAALAHTDANQMANSSPCPAPTGTVPPPRPDQISRHDASPVPACSPTNRTGSQPPTCRAARRAWPSAETAAPCVVEMEYRWPAALLRRACCQRNAAQPAAQSPEKIAARCARFIW